MSVKTKLTEIANDIREILKEQNGMTLDEMAQKLDTVKSQIVQAIAAVNAVTGNVTTLPEMSEQVGILTNVALAWAIVAVQTATELNGEDFSELLNAGASYADEALIAAYVQEAAEMKAALKASYAAIKDKLGTVPAESEQYLKNMEAAIQSIGDVEGVNREKVMLWFSATINLLNLVNAVDVSGFTEEDAYADETMNVVGAHAQAIATAMGRINTAITEMGGTAPLAVAVDNFPAAIRTIPTGEAWYTFALSLLTALNGFDPSTITGGMHDSATQEAAAAAATQAQSDLNAAYTTIEANGGTAPENKTIANLSAAIDSIPHATGVTVRRQTGTFTTDSTGKATITDLAFKPDVFVITGLKYGSSETQLAFVYPEAVNPDSGYAVLAATWTDEHEYGLEASMKRLWSGGYQSMEITMYSYYSSGNTTPVRDTTFSYAAIKYTE